MDTLEGAEVQAVGQLYAEDGTFITTCRSVASLTAGLNRLRFYIPAQNIYRVGISGPYHLRLFSIWEIFGEDSRVSLQSTGDVAITQPYSIEDFAASPVYTVGGTVAGLDGEGLQLMDVVSYASIEPGNGPFTFSQARSIGSAYDVRVTTQPTNPMQVCSVLNAKGTIGPANVTDIAVECVTTMTEAGLDPDFGSGGKVTAEEEGATAIALQSDGKIVLLGDHTLLRYDSSGNLDDSFGTGGVVSDVVGDSFFAVAKSVAVQLDGKIVVAGYTPVDPQNIHFDFALARYTAEGALDPDFGGGRVVSTDFAGGYDEARSVLVQCDGGIVVAGLAADGPVGKSQVGIARYTTEGALDSAFGGGGKVMTPIPGGSGSASWAVLQPDGKLVLLGLMDVGYDGEGYGLLRYAVDGALDPDFGAGGIAQIEFVAVPTGLALQDDGQIVVVGWVGGTPDAFVVERFDATGHPDPGFGSGGLVTTPFGGQDEWAQAVAIQEDGRIVVAGYTVDETAGFSKEDFALARYTVEGEPDDSFGFGGQETFDFFGQSDRARCLAIQPDGKIVVAGSASQGTLLGLLRLLP